MDIQSFLKQKTAELAAAGISSARLDVLVLLEHVLGIDRAHLLAHPERRLSPTALRTLNNKCTQRMNHLPLSYLTNKAFFCGRQFYIDHTVLVPRPETESMISLLLSLPLPATPRVADIGTGSGCLAITAALELPPGSLIDACDVSLAALNVARENAQMLDATIAFHHTNLLDGCPEPQDIILANLPYVPDGYPINRAASQEPRIALFSGTDGLDDYRLLWKQITALAQKPAFVITEALKGQHKPLAALAAAAGYKKSQTLGLAQLFRLQN